METIRGNRRVIFALTLVQYLTKGAGLMSKDMRKLEKAVVEMGHEVADLQEKIMETEDSLADSHLKLVLLDGNKKRGFEDLQVVYVRRLVRNRRKLDDLQLLLAQEQERLAQAKAELNNIVAELPIAQS